MVNPFLYEVEEIDTAYLVADESQQVSPSTAEEDRDKLQAPPTNESQNEDTSAVNLVQDGQNMSVPAPDNETITPRTLRGNWTERACHQQNASGVLEKLRLLTITNIQANRFSQR